MKPVVFLQPARQEMLDAAHYYELQAPGLGDDFLDAIDSALRDIRDHPNASPVIHAGVRRHLLHRFPYALLYRVDSERVFVLAVMHLHRHPLYWTDRI
jgi:toxin ParE1/3/4